MNMKNEFEEWWYEEGNNDYAQDKAEELWNGPPNAKGFSELA